MRIDVLAMVNLYGDSWEEAFRHIEHKKWSDWALKKYGMKQYKRDDMRDHTHDALRYSQPITDMTMPLPEDE